MADVVWVDREWFAGRLQAVEVDLASIADEAEGRDPAEVEAHVEAARTSVIQALKVLGVYR